METLWTVIPTILCIVIFIYGYVYYDRYTTIPENAYRSNFTKNGFGPLINGKKKTLGELYVPANKPIRLVMTSEDVYSFFVPTFRVKQDVIGNRYTFINFTATKGGSRFIVRIIWIIIQICSKSACSSWLEYLNESGESENFKDCFRYTT